MSVSERDSMRWRERIKSLPCKVLITVSASLHGSFSTDPCRVASERRAYDYTWGTVGLCVSVCVCVNVCSGCVSFLLISEHGRQDNTLAVHMLTLSAMYRIHNLSNRHVLVAWGHRVYDHTFTSGSRGGCGFTGDCQASDRGSRLSFNICKHDNAG